MERITERPVVAQKSLRSTGKGLPVGEVKEALSGIGICSERIDEERERRGWVPEGERAAGRAVWV